MAYFLGKDVSVYISTEDTITASFANVSAAGAVTFDTSTGTYQFAGPLSGSLTDGTVPAETNLTGIDLSIGAVDEDITYMGKRSVTKAEIKKETTVSLTRKKSDKLWSTLAQGKTDSGHSYGSGGHTGRWGLIKESGSGTIAKIADGTVDPKSSTNGSVVTYGYRVAVQLKGSTEVVITIFGITIDFGNNSFSSLHVIPDDLFWFYLLKIVLQDSLITVCVLERPSELSLLTLV